MCSPRARKLLELQGSKSIECWPKGIGLLCFAKIPWFALQKDILQAIPFCKQFHFASNSILQAIPFCKQNVMQKCDAKMYFCKAMQSNAKQWPM